MGIQVQWDDPDNTVIRVDYVGQWTWDEFYEMNKVTRSMMASVPHRVDLMIDMLHTKLPVSGPAISAAQTAFKAMPANWGNIIIAGNGFFQALISVFKNVDRHFAARVFSVKTLDDGRALIARQRAAKVAQPER